MTPYPREEIEAALRRQREIIDQQVWDEYCELFTSDGVYVEHEMGTFVGPAAIKEWIVPTMAPLVNSKWEYPMDWLIPRSPKLAADLGQRDRLGSS